MENTTALDSNSESDISDSWALIDEDSSLEWNNEMGLSPRKFVLEKNEVPRTSSRNELSDEDSIEVVADDHTDCLNDNEAEGLKDNQQSVGLSENLNVLPEIDGSKDIPAIVTPYVQNVPDHPRTVTEYKPTPALIVLFLVGIIGGIAVGYSWAFYLQASESSASIQNTRALFAKLQNENLFLKNQLRFTHSSLRTAVANLPEYKQTSMLGIGKDPLRSSISIDDTGLCKITDFILQSHFSSNNISSDVCLATDKPWEDSDHLVMNTNEITGAPTGLDAKLSANIVNVLSTSEKKVEQNPKDNEDSLQIDKTPVQNEISSAVTNGLLEEHLCKKNASQHKHTFENELSDTDVKSNETGGDPRPFTKARSIVEKMYTMLSVLGDDFQPSLPSKVELLSILTPDGIEFSVESFTPVNYNNIIAFKNQMQVTAQKMLNGIESSINRFLKNVANKFKKFETNNIKQICKLKRTLENSPDKNHVDWNKPIFQKCVDYWQNGHNKAKQIKSEIKVTKFLQENKDSTGNIRATFDNTKVNHLNYIEQKRSHDRDTYHPKENNQQTSTMNENLEFVGEKTKKASKKLPTLDKNVSEMDKSKKYDSDVEEKGNYLKHKNKQVQTYKQKKRWKEGRQGKEDNEDRLRNRKHGTYDKKRIFEETEKNVNKMSNDVNTRKYEKHGKKTFDEKERKNENNNDYKKRKDKRIVYEDDGMSGEWMQKMARGRAEQRRREHQSDWVFDRAESRRSKRRKERRTYWYEPQDYSETVLNSNICNKTKVFKDQASKAWKDIKYRVKENVWRPIVDTAKTAKRVFNNFNYYHSHQE